MVVKESDTTHEMVRSNTIRPAMLVGAFVADPKNFPKKPDSRLILVLCHA
jgi:hypothetical protein